MKPVEENANPQNPENTSESTKRTLPEAAEPYKWKPGQSGNPGGRPKKKPVTELYERMLADPEFLAVAEMAAKKAIAKGSMAMVLQLKEMAERVEGKVTQPVEADINLHLSLAERMKKASERAANR